MRNCWETRGLTVEQRFWFYTKKRDNGCWEWDGAKREGYGRLFVGKRKYVSAHGFSYELHKDKILKGLVIDHLCRNPSCVNPSHLEAVTDQVNILRGTGIAAANAKKTACAKGHEFTEENTGRKPTGRYCKKCQQMRNSGRKNHG